MVTLAELAGFRSAGGTVSGAPAKPSSTENASRLVYFLRQVRVSRRCLVESFIKKRERAPAGGGADFITNQTMRVFHVVAPFIFSTFFIVKFMYG
jgi:hypothetical protein